MKINPLCLAVFSLGSFATAKVELVPSFRLAGSLAGDKAVFAPDSFCTMKVKEFPWVVDCDVGINIDVGSAFLNGGDPVEMRASAEDLANDTDPQARLTYSVWVEPLEVVLDTLFFNRTIGTDGKPISLLDYEVVLMKDGLEEGICLSSTESDKFVVGATQLLAEAVGGDVCVSVLDLFFTSDDSGGRFKLVVDFSLFDPDKTSRDRFMDKVHKALNLTAPLVYSLDLGKLALQQEGSQETVQVTKSLKKASQQKAALPIDNEGNFLLGTEAEAITEGGETTGDGSSSSAMECCIFSSFFALITMGAWLQI